MLSFEVKEKNYKHLDLGLDMLDPRESESSFTNFHIADFKTTSKFLVSRCIIDFGPINKQSYSTYFGYVAFWLGPPRDSDNIDLSLSFKRGKQEDD